jgi:hypothetical protein
MQFSRSPSATRRKRVRDVYGADHRAASNPGGWSALCLDQLLSVHARGQSATPTLEETERDDTAKQGLLDQ